MERESLARHILPASATMVGVCLTSISLVKLLEERIGLIHVDEYLSLTSVVFLISAVLSYLSLRSVSGRHPKFERIADVLFMLGLLGMTVIGVLFAYEAI